MVTTITKKTGLVYLWLSFVIVIFDLGSKWLAIGYLQPLQSIQLLPVFSLTYAQNSGAAFSFLASHSGWQKYFFIIIAVIFSGVLTYWLYKNSIKQSLLNTAYASVIGGAIANMIDRSYHGYVVDFLHFYWDIYHYPIFNFADIAICFGALLLIIDYFKSDKRQKDKKPLTKDMK